MMLHDQRRRYELSLGQAVKLEGETLGKAKRTLYRQLLVELDRACSSP
jgi:hypothetical protein